MKKTLKITAITLCSMFLMTIASFAQGMKDIRINEVLLNNTYGYLDDNGQRSSWIELHNTGYSSVNVAGSHLVVVRNGDTTSYKIPKNDVRTVIPPKGFVTFHADGIAEKGTFYTNFNLFGIGKLMLLDASGKGEPLSSVDFNFEKSLMNISMGYLQTGKDEEGWCNMLTYATPNGVNNNLNIDPRSELFRKQDPRGFVMAITAMSVVFFALLLIFQVFKQVGRFMIYRTKRSDAKNRKTTITEDISDSKAPKGVEDDAIQAEVIAAIAVAINQFEEDLHDLESNIVTINRVTRAYSPWSSKIYGINNQPIKK